MRNQRIYFDQLEYRRGQARAARRQLFSDLLLMAALAATGALLLHGILGAV